MLDACDQRPIPHYLIKKINLHKPSVSAIFNRGLKPPASLQVPAGLLPHMAAGGLTSRLSRRYRTPSVPSW